jgi:peptide deformylase
MALLKLHLFGSPVLRQESKPVAEVTDETRRFIDDLFETMDAARGVGLAANQVGVATRIAVVDADGQRFAMVNPRVIEPGPTMTAEEGCLSIPDYFADVKRPGTVALEALDRDGKTFRLEATGLVARAIQHELDHLDGILFVDHLSPLKREMLLKRYKREHAGDTSYIRDVSEITPERDDDGD